MSLPDDDRLHEIALNLARVHYGTGTEEWARLLDAALREDGYAPGPEEMHEAAKRMLVRANRAVARDEAEERAEAILAQLMVLREEWLEVLRAGGVTDDTDVVIADMRKDAPLVVALLAALRDVDLRTLDRLTARVIGLGEELARVVAPFPELGRYVEMAGSSSWQTMKSFHAKLVAVLAAEAREERLARRAEARPADPPPPVEEKCSSCRVKPARVGDLCKRCAHASGALPKGKIGEAL